jgi:hypothetical protein
MARKLPIQYPGAIYHMMNRVDRLLAEGALPTIAPLGAGCLASGWKGGGVTIRARSRSGLSGAGAWDGKRFGRSCWRR